jgi:hypothetical protein
MMFLSLSLVSRNAGSNAYTVTVGSALHLPKRNAFIYNNLGRNQPMRAYDYWESFACGRNSQSVGPNAIDVYS